MFHTKVLEKIKTHFLVSTTFSENRAIYENVEKYGTAGQAKEFNIIRRMRSADWTIKTSKTPSEYIILIDFPLQQWLLESASVLLYTYIA